MTPLMTPIRARLAGLAVAGAALATFAASAAASTPATGHARTAITAAVHGTTVGGVNTVPRSHYTVTDIRISSVSRSWASASLTATRAYRSTFQNVTVVLVEPAGTSKWVVVDLGSAQVGCGIAPDKVLADLYRARRPCPTGQIG